MAPAWQSRGVQSPLPHWTPPPTFSSCYFETKPWPRWGQVCVCVCVCVCVWGGGCPGSFSLKRKKLKWRREVLREGQGHMFAQCLSCSTYFTCSLPSRSHSTDEATEAQGHKQFISIAQQVRGKVEIPSQAHWLEGCCFGSSPPFPFGISLGEVWPVQCA